MMPREAMMLSPKDPKLPFQIEQEKWMRHYLGNRLYESFDEQVIEREQDDGLFCPPDDRDYP